MRNMLGLARSRTLFVLALAACLSLFVAACGDDDDDGGSGGSSTKVKETVAASDCGPDTGKKATGSPIKLGAIATKQPGTDFSGIPSMAQAYFKCVNDNGGINGHPIEYVIETEQTDPPRSRRWPRSSSRARRSSGIVGSTSLIECAVNHEYYEQKNFYVIAAGIAPELLPDAEHRVGEHGPALQLRRRRAVPGPRGREEDRPRPGATCRAPSTSRRARAHRRGHDIPITAASRRTCRSRTPTPSR